MKQNRTIKKIFFQGVLGSFIAQLSTMIFGVVSVYLGIRYFGPIVYGIWLTIKSLLGFSNFTLFGIDTVSATLLAQNDKVSIQRAIIGRSLKLLSVIMLIGLLITAIILLFFPHFFSMILGKIETQYQSASIYALGILLIGQLIQLPLTMSISIFTGLQQVHLAKFYQIILPGALNFLALIITIALGYNIVLLSILTACAMILSAGAGLIHIFIQNKALRFSLREQFSAFPSSKYLLNKGSRYFMFGLATMIMINSDNLVINHFLGPDYVSKFAIAFKLFSLAYVLVALINSALWPIISNKIGTNQWDWLNDNFNFLVNLFLIFGGLICLGGIAFAKPIIILWAGSNNYAGNITTILFAIYGLALSFSILNNTMLNSLNETSLRTWLIPIEFTINLTLSIVLINFIGISGVILGTLAALLATEVWVFPIGIFKTTGNRIKVNLPTPITLLILAVTPLSVILSFMMDRNDLLSIAMKAMLVIAYFVISWFILPANQKQLLKQCVQAKFYRPSS